MQANPASNQEALYQEEYYTQKANYSYRDERKSWHFDNYVWQARLRNIARFIPAPANFLDVGCAFGGFVAAAQQAGYQAQGLDISEYAIAHAKKQGLPIQQGDLSNNTLADESFDVITMIEVLEHLPEPQKVLKHITRLLRPGGLALIQTANFLGWQARWAGKNYHYYLPGHLYYYSTNNLRQLFSDWGFGYFHFYHGVDFGLLPKLKKSRGNFHSMKDYLQWLRIAYYHNISRIAYKDFALSSSMVMYAHLR